VPARPAQAGSQAQALIPPSNDHPASGRYPSLTSASELLVHRSRAFAWASPLSHSPPLHPPSLKWPSPASPSRRLRARLRPACPPPASRSTSPPSPTTTTAAPAPTSPPGLLVRMETPSSTASTVRAWATGRSRRGEGGEASEVELELNRGGDGRRDLPAKIKNEHRDRRLLLFVWRYTNNCRVRPAVVGSRFPSLSPTPSPLRPHVVCIPQLHRSTDAMRWPNSPSPDCIRPHTPTQSRQDSSTS
jgi:hypothetical protein